MNFSFHRLIDDFFTTGWEEMEVIEIPSDWSELYLMVTREDLIRCPVCGEVRMILKEDVSARS